MNYAAPGAEERSRADAEARRMIPLDGKGALRWRTVSLDIEALAADNRKRQLVGQGGLCEACASPVTDWCQGSFARFTLFPDLSFVAGNVHVKQSSATGVWSWKGSFEHNGQEGSVLLSIDSSKEATSGTVFVGDDMYVIEATFSLPLHVIYQVDRGASSSGRTSDEPAVAPPPVTESGNGQLSDGTSDPEAVPCACFGGTHIYWPASDHQVTHYQLFRSPLNEPADKTLIYEGEHTSIYTSSHSPEPEVLWLRVCNQAGCSGFREGSETTAPMLACR